MHYQKFVDLAPHDPQAPEIMRILDNYSKRSVKPSRASPRHHFSTTSVRRCSAQAASSWPGFTGRSLP